MSAATIGVLPTGTANLASVYGALGRLGATPQVLTTPEQVRDAAAVLLPGVGAFGAAMRTLAPFAVALRDRVAADRPTLGICLGMQVFAASSEESTGVPGLSVLPGAVTRLTGDRVPHLGWNRIRVEGAGTVLTGEADVSFAHSFALAEAPPDWTVASVSLAGRDVVAAVERGRVLLCQFHPELSGPWGEALLGRWWDAARGLPLRPLPAAEDRPGGLVRRLIPCLDVRDGRVVKGVRFQGLRDAGDPVALARAYAEAGADQLVLLDVSATDEGRLSARDTVRAVRAALSIPLVVGGGVRRVEDGGALLEAGADQVAVNTAAVEDPALLTALATTYGAQCVVLALDAARRLDGAGWEVVVQAGKRRTGLDAVDWARRAVALGAGEILLTSWDRDGTGTGYDLALITAIRAAVAVPVIASGGASSAADLVDAVRAGADAVLVASILHDGHTDVPTLKSSLAAAGVEVRR
jgi:cyclase